MVAAIAAVTLAGCSLSEETPRASVPDASQKSSASPDTGCLDAGNVARAILADARNGANLTVVDAKAVRSVDLDGTYLVAIRFDGDPVENSGVWASTSLDLGDSSVRSVDTSAVEVTTWPWALVSEPKIAVDDPGVAAALSCL
jgi:hypothetical protein